MLYYTGALGPQPRRPSDPVPEKFSRRETINLPNTEAHSIWKGIVLAADPYASASPDQVISKQILPVYDKPMIYYPIIPAFFSPRSRDPDHHQSSGAKPLHALLGTASMGREAQLCLQASPGGLAQAYLIGRDFPVWRSLMPCAGRNILYGHGLTEELKPAPLSGGCVGLAYRVPDPQRYGVVEFSDDARVIFLEEKPKEPSSNFAGPRHLFPRCARPDFAQTLKPSARGELEITDLIESSGSRPLTRARPGRGIAWFDTGTPSSLLKHRLSSRRSCRVKASRSSCLEGNRVVSA